MEPRFYLVFITALIPLIIGAIYYHPKVMGTVWMKANGFEMKDLEGANMPVIFILSYVFGVMISYGLMSSVIHQMSVYSLIMVDPLPVSQEVYDSVMDNFGRRYLTFGHGALHGAFASLFIALPLIATNALFERRSWKYIGIHLLYWTICFALIGGVLCLYII